VQGTVELLERGGKEDFSRLRLELAGQNQAFKREVAAASLRSDFVGIWTAVHRK